MSQPNLRQRKKALMRQTIQSEALRLFLAQGYEATTVEAIAAAANVSPMTFFRYFPTKEDVVLRDEYDALLIERLKSRPADEAPLEKLRHAVKEGLTQVYQEAREMLLLRTRLIMSTPALRARQWDQQHASEQFITEAIGMRADNATPDLRARVIVAAGFAALSTAVLVWAEENGTHELPDLIDQAFEFISQETRRIHD